MSAGMGLYEAVGQASYFRATDGMECKLLPRASVQVGNTSADAPANELPCHHVELSSFLIDVEPVSVGAFARFLNIAQPPPKAQHDWVGLLDGDLRDCHFPLCRNLESGVWEAKAGVPLSWPMIMVSWYGANAYSLWANGCDWREYRSSEQSFLPTEAQWEYAARGAEPAPFPWGSTPPSPSLLNVCWNTSAHDLDSHVSTPLPELPLVPVNACQGVSPFGLRHMAGNVWQWCRDSYNADFYCSAAASLPDAWDPSQGAPKSERGGSWVGPAELARSSYRRGRLPEAVGRCLGFRCVGKSADVEGSTTAGSENDEDLSTITHL